MDNFELVDSLRAELNSDRYLATLVPLGAAYFISQYREDVCNSLSHQWAQLLIIEQDLNSMIIEHFREIEVAEPLLKDTFSLLWTGVELSNITLKKVMLWINNNVRKENTGTWIKELIQEISELIGVKSGFSTTLDSLSHLIGGFVSNGETLYDGTCGCGNLLVACLGDDEHKIKVYGQEVNAVSVAIAKLNLYVNNIRNFDIKCGNTLSAPGHVDGIKLKQFDNVVMNIPFSLKNWSDGIDVADLYNRFKYGMPGKNNGDYAFILHALASLNEQGKAYIVVPVGVLFRGAVEGKIRSELIKQDLVEGVIALPNNLLTNTAIPVSILILNKNKEESRKGKITFVNAQDMGTRQRRQTILSNQESEKIICAYNEKKEIKEFIRILDIDKLDENNLSVNRYFIKNEIEVDGQMYELNIGAFEKKGEYVNFSEAADFYRGINPPKQCDEDDATHKLVQLSDVQESKIVKDTLTSVQLLNEHKVLGYMIKAGDVIISARGSNVKIVLAGIEDDGLILSNHFIGIRPKNGITGECIRAYLKSPLGQFYLQQRMQGSAIVVLKEKDLYNMPFPVVQKEQVTNISTTINAAEDQLKNALEKAYREYNQKLENVYELMGIKQIIK